jgi:hypothetical protein
VLPEVGGAGAGGSKAGWIRHALAPETLGGFPRVRALVWFDVAKEQPWQLRSSDASYEAWLAALRQGNVASALEEPGLTR